MVTPMPVQPIKDGRFIKNRIVDFLVDSLPGGLNKIAVMDFTNEERMQLAQLIGYSVSGYSSLSYVSDESYAATDAIACGTANNELDGRNEVLRERLKEAEEHVRNAAVALFRVHPDDLTT